MADATAALDLDAAVGEPPSLKARLRRAAAHERAGAKDAQNAEQLGRATSETQKLKAQMPPTHPALILLTAG